MAEMRERFLRQRAELAQESIRTSEGINRSGAGGALDDALLERLTAPNSTHAAVFDDPVFAIWLRFLCRAVAKGDVNEVAGHAARLQQVLHRVEQRLSGKDRHYIAGSSISVQRDDLDPYVMAATPPSYDFSAQTVSGVSGHPLPLQADLLGVAIQNIGGVWPELGAQLHEFVKIIGYLPDATFRSCSAARYAGIIYLGNMDESMVDIEESLAHECGHQVLYRLDEVQPLVSSLGKTEALYELPWSGSKRDLFGYLHAYFIYLLLAKYYVLRAGNRKDHAEEALRRARLITLGLAIARPQLEAAKHLTEQGRELLLELGADVERLQRALLGRVVH